MSTPPTIGFIGLGVMGSGMCRNIALKHDGPVIAYDANPAAASFLEGTPAVLVASVAEVAARADIVCLSLPGDAQVRQVCCGDGGLAAQPRQPQVIVDLSTTSVAGARAIAAELAAHDIAFADAPVARTREAAQRGELSIMVGADAGMFARIEPVLRYMGTDVTHCGEVGCGQVVKLVNNALVAEHVVALAEMMVISERAGVKPAVLLDAVSKGSGDSFVLRNHGRKAMLPREFPERAFPPEYMVKDISYVLALADEMRVPARVAELAKRYYEAASTQGFSGRYFPVVIDLIDQGIDIPA
ncbi:NAD(P)-dependent oxidoreductase [soil metagenome]